MAKSKDRSDTEALKAIIRHQKKVIKQLTKDVNRANKKHSREEDLENDLQEYILKEAAEQNKDTSNNCPKCQGTLEISDLGIRILSRCVNCGHRSSSKK